MNIWRKFASLPESVKGQMRDEHRRKKRARDKAIKRCLEIKGIRVVDKRFVKR